MRGVRKLGWRWRACACEPASGDPRPLRSYHDVDAPKASAFLDYRFEGL